MNTEIENSLQKAAGLCFKARQLVAFTGAGISTPSGIPDFRSSSTGLWEQDDPMQVASLTSFLHTPQRFFNWLRPLARTCFTAFPNPAHFALAEMEQKGHLKAVITQNIDDLHYRAGSRNIYELHGSLRTATCTGCKKVYPSSEIMVEYLDKGAPPLCPECLFILKPDIVLFEEQLPAATWYQAEKIAQSSDVILVVGSSLSVTPAAYIPLEAVQAGAKLIIINQTPTFLDSAAEVILAENAADVLPRIVAQMKK